MKKSILRASAAWHVVAVLGAGVATMVAAPASAQDYTSGAVTGTVKNPSGAPVSGASVTLTSQAQGLTRSFVTGPNGTFTASGVSPGLYNLSVTASGYSRSEDVITVTAATSSTVTVGLVTQSTNADIVVTGRARQAQTQAATGLNIDVAAVTANIAVPRNLTGLVLLAPTTQRGSTFFGDVPAIGGGSVAENAYYINGLNITNPDTYIGSARVPFEFYKTVDVQTGGYPAEFGRATGGVVNATTKSGTNIPFIAMHLNWAPASLRGHSKNIGLATNPSNIAQLDESDNKTASLEIGAPIIKNHLFAYGMIEAHRDRTEFASQSAKSFRRQVSKDPFWGIKLDGYINPTQHAEFTIFDTRTTITDSAYSFAGTAPAYNGGTIGALKGVRKIELGGINWVGRYTGDVTDFLTLSAAYGVSKDKNNTLPADVSSYFVSDSRGGDTSILSLNQPFATNNVISTKRRFYRADADVRVNFAGQHRFRAGFDNEDLSETKTTKANGVIPALYFYDETGINIVYEALGGKVAGTDTAYYVQDTWTTPVDGLTLNLGIRNDVFKQYNLSNERYANLKGNWGPRAAFTYTPPSMDKWKFFGSFGRYYIPPAMNLGFRGKDLYFEAYFDYPIAGDPSSLVINPATGLPAGPVGTIIPGLDGYGTPCPAAPGLGTAPGTPVFAGSNCAVYGAGVQDPALAKYGLDAKATSEDEFILGTRYRASNLLSFGLQGTYRKLNRVSEDTDFRSQYVNYWCGAGGGLAGAKDAAECSFYQANTAYHIWNPGADSVNVNDFYQATLGKALPVTLTGLKFPKPKRTYKAVVFDFDRRDDGRWLAGGSVTWSSLRGNYEGNVRSDVGNGGQRDAGALIDYDYLGLTDYTNGRLFGDHKYVFKLFGAYHFGRMFTLGANILVQSPGHGSCFAIHPTDPDAAAYGSLSSYCGSGLTRSASGAPIYATNVPSPRGTGFKTDWLKQVDLSARVNLPFGEANSRKVTLRADVFNVFNSKAVLNRNGTSEVSQRADGRYNGSKTFLLPNAYQTPRVVRLGLDILIGGVSRAPAPVEVIAPPPPPPPEAPATQTCADGTVILATAMCPVAAPPPPPPPPPASSGERG